MEQLDLSVPEYPGPSTSTWKVDQLNLRWSAATIEILLIGQNNERRSFGYSGDTATTLMKALNTANLSVKSLQRRVLERLISDGKLAGSISGLPD